LSFISTDQSKAVETDFEYSKVGCKKIAGIAGY